MMLVFISIQKPKPVIRSHVMFQDEWRCVLIQAGFRKDFNTGSELKMKRFLKDNSHFGYSYIFNSTKSVKKRVVLVSGSMLNIRF